jgi:hypothetical protein
VSQQEQQGERQQYEAEAYHLSLDNDRCYLAWLEYEHHKLMALIEAAEKQ